MKETDKESFRDSLTTVGSQGNRLWVYAKEPKGFFTNRRTFVSLLLILVFFITPFIKIGTKPLFLFNIFERKFIVFGVLFWPQDFHIFLFITLIFFVFIVLFTAVFGRIFCGWICPQTIFMESVFRKIEYWIEGDFHTQQKNDQHKDGIAYKKILKYIVFAIISFLIGNLAMSYLVGIDKLSFLITHPIAANKGLFVGVVIFSALFFFVFTWLREQACTIVCPYGRLQGVLQTNETLGVVYDFIRGEPRGKISKNMPTTTTLGDCIDCKICVQVCPTGIDIRNGSQLECTNCTACIDACDTVMSQINRPLGLIRYDSANGILTKKTWSLTPRVVAYSAVLVGLCMVLAYSLVSRKEIEAYIKRVPGTLAQTNTNGNITNLYNIQLINKSSRNLKLVLVPNKSYAKVKIVGDLLMVNHEEITEAVFFLEIPRDKLKENKQEIMFKLMSDNEEIAQVKTNFFSF